MSYNNNNVLRCIRFRDLRINIPHDYEYNIDLGIVIRITVWYSFLCTALRSIVVSICSSVTEIRCLHNCLGLVPPSISLNLRAAFANKSSYKFANIPKSYEWNLEILQQETSGGGQEYHIVDELRKMTKTGNVIIS